jgi:hypothetical protein
MKIGYILLFFGLVMLMAGIYLSMYWGIIGVLMAVIGGGVLGSSTYFFVATKKNNHSQAIGCVRIIRLTSFYWLTFF